MHMYDKHMSVILRNYQSSVYSYMIIENKLFVVLEYANNVQLDLG